MSEQLFIPFRHARSAHTPWCTAATQKLTQETMQVPKALQVSVSGHSCVASHFLFTSIGKPSAQPIERILLHTCSQSCSSAAALGERASVQLAMPTAKTTDVENRCRFTAS